MRCWNQGKLEGCMLEEVLESRTSIEKNTTF